MLEGAAKLLFSVPARFDAAFAQHVQSFLSPRSHPLLYRGKNVFFIPDAATIRQFDISVRQCGVGEFVYIDNCVWHCGVNLGANCSISVNILGTGGINALHRDVQAIVDDLCDQRMRMIRFHDQQTRGALNMDEKEWRADWNAALKQLQKQVHIYMSRTNSHTALHCSHPSHSRKRLLSFPRYHRLPRTSHPRLGTSQVRLSVQKRITVHSFTGLYVCVLWRCRVVGRPSCATVACYASALRTVSSYQGGRAVNLLSDPAVLPPVHLPVTGSVPPTHPFFADALTLRPPSLQELSEVVQQRGDRLAQHWCPARLVA